MRQSPVTLPSKEFRETHSQVQHDEAAFEAFFLQHYQRLYQVIFRLLGDSAEAEDLVLETFWRMWERFPLSGENPSGWLYRVAMNLGYNAGRADKRRLHYEEQAWLTRTEYAAPADPANEAERAEESERVRRALHRLPSRDAQLLILRHSGFSYREVAAALDLAPNSIGTLLTRAEREFEKAYEEENRHDRGSGSPASD